MVELGIPEISINTQTLVPIGIVLLICLTLFLLVRYSRAKSFDVWASKENLPNELHPENASLLMSEEWMPLKYRWRARKGVFRIRTPIKVSGKPDQVYRVFDSDRVVVVDTKSGNSRRIYRSHVIQLSVYALILKRKLGLPVASYAYIRREAADSIAYQKVSLLSEDEVVQVYQRFINVISGNSTPARACAKGLCRHCCQIQECRLLHKAGTLSKKAA